MARQVKPTPALPTKSGQDPRSIQAYLVELVRNLVRELSELAQGINDAAKQLDTPANPVALPSFTVAGVPAASAWTAHLIYVSNEAGGAIPAFSDGTNWRRVTDRAIIS